MGEYSSHSVDELSNVVIGAAIRVHSALGPGLLEKSYQRCLEYELKEMGVLIESEVDLPLIYKGIKLETGYRIDLLVEKKLIIELKAVEIISDLHIAQTLTYMRLSKIDLGLILNFNVTSLKSGIKRVIL